MAKGTKKAGNGKAANDDGFDQGGPDGPAKQRKAGGHGEPGHNSRDPKKDAKRLAEGIETIRGYHQKIREIQEGARAATAPHNESIAAVKKSLQTDGFKVKVINALIKEMRLREDADSVASKFDEDHAAEFDRCKDILGEWASDTPLGRYANEQADREAAHH